MMNVIALVVLLFAACTASTHPVEHPPGESSPGSPGSAWTTQGGPASPGSPSMGTLTTLDAGTDTGPR